MSDPFVAPDYPESPDSAAAPAPTAPPPPTSQEMLANLQAELDAYLQAQMARIQKDVADMMTRAGVGVGAAPAAPFRHGG